MKKVVLNHVFEFGKIAYSSNRKINRVTIEVTIYEHENKALTIDGEEIEKYLTFTASANVWNNIQSDIVAGGQMIDELAKDYFKNNTKFQAIFKIWQKWHLNDLKAGTRKQNAHIKRVRENFPKLVSDYSNQCYELGLVDLLIDNGYKYGSKWLLEPLPDSVLNEVSNLVLND